MGLAGFEVEIQRQNGGGVVTEDMTLNMGPQHPSTHGVLRLVLHTDGEIIREVTPHLGYLHRCAEKIGENVTPIQFIPYTDRMDYLAGMNMNLGYSLAVEKLCGMVIPEKANVIRVLVSELNRIASHLVGMGAYGLDLGTFSPFLYAFREREHILDLFEDVCGARLTYSYLTIGGVHDDEAFAAFDELQKIALGFLGPAGADVVADHDVVVGEVGVKVHALDPRHRATEVWLKAVGNRYRGDVDFELAAVFEDLLH